MADKSMNHPLSTRGIAWTCFDLILVILGVVFWLGQFTISYGSLSGQTENSIVASDHQLRLERNWFSVPLESMYLVEKPSWIRTTAISVDYGRNVTHSSSDWDFLDFHALHDVISEDSKPVQETSALVFPAWFNVALIFMGLGPLIYRFYRLSNRQKQDGL